MSVVVFVGRLGMAPELKEANGKKFCKLLVAEDNIKGDPDWHNVVVFNENQAQACANFLVKGQRVYVNGRISYNVVEKEGKKITYTSIIAHQVEFLDKPQAKMTDAAAAMPDTAPAAVTDTPDIPF